MAIAEPQFDDLYREVIIDHFRKPRNRGTLPAPSQHAEGMNPVCGDEIALDLDVSGGTIAALAFTGQGCSISQSSASMMTQQVRGRSIVEAERIADLVSAMLVDGAEPSAEIGDLEALQGVAKFPVRVKCALLAWKVLREGLDQAKSPAAAAL
ncbi:MAG: SUF system NifU family Fe-S cluster assembly protein [Dehalococcoidia bacterium]|nr:SUF system NifU family Fe-S cluster assembly protein [Dehalococcoidia bacterium]